MSTTGLSQNYFLYFKKLIFSQFSDPILVFGPENIFFNNFFGQTTVFPRIRDIFGSQQNCCCDYSLEIKKMASYSLLMFLCSQSRRSYSPPSRVLEVRAGLLWHCTITVQSRLLPMENQVQSTTIHSGPVVDSTLIRSTPYIH